MKKYVNVNTGSELTEKEYKELLEREWTAMYEAKELPIFWDDEDMTKEEFFAYMKDHDVDTDFKEVEEE